jgi:hypothetical protein
MIIGMHVNTDMMMELRKFLENKMVVQKELLHSVIG